MTDHSSWGFEWKDGEIVALTIGGNGGLSGHYGPDHAFVEIANLAAKQQRAKVDHEIVDEALRVMHCDGTDRLRHALDFFAEHGHWPPGLIGLIDPVTGYVAIAEGHICGHGKTEAEAAAAAKGVTDRGVGIWPATSKLLHALRQNAQPQGRGVDWKVLSGVAMLQSQNQEV